MCDDSQIRMGRIGAQDADGCCPEHQMLPAGYVGTDPACGQAATELPTGKQRHVAAQPRQACDQSIGTGRDIHDAFAPRAAVAKDGPTRPAAPDLVRCAALVGAVVPFREIGRHLRALAEPGQGARRSCAARRAAQYAIEGYGPERGGKSARLRLATRGQRDIGAAGVLPGQGPRGLAVANEIEPQRGYSRAGQDASRSLGPPSIACV